MKSVSYSAAAFAQLRKLSPAVRERIVKRLDQYSITNHGDVKKLKGRTGLRLRVGDCASFSLRMTSVSWSCHSGIAVMSTDKEDVMPVKFQGGFAVLPRKEYESLKALAEEAFEDRETARIVDEEMSKVAAGMPTFPLEVVDRLINGENAIRVLREFRGLTQAELATSEVVQITQNYLSDLENGKRKGPIALHRKIARALGVPLDMLAPIAVSEQEADPKVFASRSRAIADTKRARGKR